jgi:hypothetical protein
MWSKMRNLIIFLSFFAFLSCGEQKSEPVKVEHYSFDPIYIKVSNKNPKVKTKFYNFDDLMIEGEYKKPQLLFIDEKQKAKFDHNSCLLMKNKKQSLINCFNSRKICFQNLKTQQKILP